MSSGGGVSRVQEKGVHEFRGRIFMSSGEGGSRA